MIIYLVLTLGIRCVFARELLRASPHNSLPDTWGCFHRSPAQHRWDLGNDGWLVLARSMALVLRFSRVRCSLFNRTRPLFAAIAPPSVNKTIHRPGMVAHRYCSLGQSDSSIERRHPPTLCWLLPSRHLMMKMIRRRCWNVESHRKSLSSENSLKRTDRHFCTDLPFQALHFSRLSLSLSPLKSQLSFDSYIKVDRYVRLNSTNIHHQFLLRRGVEAFVLINCCLEMRFICWSHSQSQVQIDAYVLSTWTLVCSLAI